MNIWRLNVGLVTMMFCLGQAQAGTSAAQDPVLVPQKALLAPAFKEIDSTVNSPASPATKEGVPPDASKASNVVSGEDNYPLVGKMEVITFGKETTNKSIDERLSDLEQEVFHNKFSDLSLFDRTQKLKLTILGPDEINQEERDIYSVPLLSSPDRTLPAKQAEPGMTYFELIAQSAENQLPVDSQDLPKFALQILNTARAQLGFLPLVMDEAANKVAESHVIDLQKRNLVSHTNAKGENPDLRYTLANGSGAMVESVITLKPEHVQKDEYTRALAAHTFKLLLERQDDRDALLSPDVTGFGFALRLVPGQKRAIVCLEISTNHGTINHLQLPLKIGDKADIYGTVEPPYRFAKVTVAWEGLSNDNPSTSEEIEEALPYFPPLDYVGYAHKSEHDYGTAKTALRMGLLVGVLAGSVFMPPVALAAPLIMLSPGGNDIPKPMSDIPMHSGIKVEGNSFSAKIPLSNSGKPGIYYVTVWATSANSNKLIPVSRRAYVLTEQSHEAENQTDSDARKTAKKEAKIEKKGQKLKDKQNKQLSNEKDN
jgi:hypothetical protein